MALAKQEDTKVKGTKATTKDTKAKATKTAPNKTGEKKKSSESVLSMAGRGRYKDMDAVAQQMVGSKSKDIEFLKLLGNPFNPVPRGDQTGSESVGLRLKYVPKVAEGETPEVLKVLTFKQKSKEVMDADWAHPVVMEVQPGEEFVLTWAEAGAFAVRDEYNGFFLGSEDEGKRLRYTPNSKAQGGIPTTKFILHGVSKGSIAEYNEDIATPEGKENRQVKPEFEEKFGVFAIQQRANSGVAMKRKDVKVNAAAIAVNAAFAELIGGGVAPEATPVAETVETPEA